MSRHVSGLGLCGSRHLEAWVCDSFELLLTHLNAYLRESERCIDMRRQAGGELDLQ